MTLELAVEPIISQITRQGLLLLLHSTPRSCVNPGNSYANDRSKLISIKFDEDKRTPRAIITVVLVFLLFAAVSLFILPLRFAQVVGPVMTSPERSQSSVHNSELAVNIDLPTSKDTNWKEPSPSIVCIPGEARCSTKIESGEQAMNRKIHGSRKSGNIYWDEPKASKRCSGFGAREYKARLWNLPLFSDWTRACREAEIEIHGVVLPRPTQCESRVRLNIQKGRL